MVHEYFLKQEELWLQAEVDAIHIADDWGTQQSLLISPDMWREYFKPCYREYCEMAHRHGKLVLMHSDGYILDILDDLVEIGVDAVNSQLQCMKLADLERFRGNIAFLGEIDRQYLLPFGRGVPREDTAGTSTGAVQPLQKRRPAALGPSPQKGRMGCFHKERRRCRLTASPSSVVTGGVFRSRKKVTVGSPFSLQQYSR